jgi:hypothetical protein
MKGFVLTAIIISALACSSSRNTGGKTFDVVTIDNERWQLKHDTLYSSTGLKFFSGQQIIIGNAAGDDGYYRSIIYKSAVISSIWGQDKRYDHAFENHIDVRKSREGVKRFLVPGKTVTIKYMGLWKNSKPNFYLVSLVSGSEVFACDLQFALSLKELTLL